MDRWDREGGGERREGRGGGEGAKRWGESGRERRKRSRRGKEGGK